MPENPRDERQLIDDELAAVVLGWEEQQRLRQQILSRARRLSARVSRIAPVAAYAGDHPRGPGASRQRS